MLGHVSIKFPLPLRLAQVLDHAGKPNPPMVTSPALGVRCEDPLRGPWRGLRRIPRGSAAEGGTVAGSVAMGKGVTGGTRAASSADACRDTFALRLGAWGISFRSGTNSPPKAGQSEAR